MLYSSINIVRRHISRFCRTILTLKNPSFEFTIRKFKRSLEENCCEGTSVSERNKGYIAICKLAAQNENIFKKFKRSVHYRPILEHVTKKQGEEYLNVIKQEGRDLIKSFSRFQENDILGSPVRFNYDVGKISPTTLRYIKVLIDLRNIFGDLDNLDICEIGGGYGGQCKIISDIFRIKSYTIVDLDAVLPLIRKYLTRLGIDNIEYLTQHQIANNKRYDLVISNYAFSECVRHVQDDYMKKILFKAQRGYITYNYDGVSNEVSPYNKEEVINLLSKKHILRIEDEKPKTGSINFIITWDDETNKPPIEFAQERQEKI